MRIKIFPERLRARWALADSLSLIQQVAEEPHPQIFEQHLRRLYPKLARYGIAMVRIDPVQIGEKAYDSTWMERHKVALRVLMMQARHGEFDLQSWNKDMQVENDKLQRFLSARPGGSETV